MDEQDLIYDWNRLPGSFDWSTVGPIELDDETLRDGLQNPSVTDPPIEAKIRLLHLMDELGIHTADIGLPGAGPRAVADVDVDDTLEAPQPRLLVSVDRARAARLGDDGLGIDIQGHLDGTAGKAIGVRFDDGDVLLVW